MAPMGVNMNQAHVHVRVVLAALALGLVLALGLASVSAGTPSPYVEFGSIQDPAGADESGHAPGLSLPCEEHHCHSLTADGCSAPSSGACCSVGAIALGAVPGAVEFHTPRAAWLPLPVVSLAGAASSVGRRPPRV
jgi:hypothetical protein